METVDFIFAKDVCISPNHNNVIKVNRALVVGAGVTKELADSVSKIKPEATVKFVDGVFYCDDLFYTNQIRLSIIDDPDNKNFDITTIL